MPNAQASRNGSPPGSQAPSSKGASAGSANSTGVASSAPVVRVSRAAHVTHAERDGVHVLRYFGRVNYMSAPAIQRFLDNLFDQGPVSGLIFDLSDAEALDSTNLGLLARVNERLRGVCQSVSMIVSRNRDITDVLVSMGFEQSFHLVTDLGATPPIGAFTNGNGNGAGDGNGNGNSDSSGSDGSDASSNAHDIETPAPSQAELHSTMLEAHRALVRLSDAGRLQFQDVVACLESDRPSH